MVLSVLKKQAGGEASGRRELHPDIASFFDSLDRPAEAPTGPFVEVSDVVRKLGKVYERFRTIVDYRDEHLLRKAAIERIIRRRFESTGVFSELAVSLVDELIRAGYIENGRLPERALADITKIFEKYGAIEHALEAHDPQNMRAYTNELRGIFASEIDDFLGYDVPLDNAVRVLGKLLRANVRLRGALNERERDYQILLACERALRANDRTSLAYALLKASIREWRELDIVRAEQFARSFPQWSSFFAHTLNHPLRYKFSRIAKRYAILFRLLFDIAKKHAGQMHQLALSVEEMRSRVLEAYLARYAAAKKRLRRGAVRAVIYLLLTKFLLALLLEIPYDMAFLGHIKWVPIIINLAFPPVLMTLVALFIKMPSKRNTGAISAGIDGLLEQGMPGNLKHEIRVSARGRGVTEAFVDLFYLITYLVTFGALIWFLRTLDFTALGILIFLFFLTVVSFFAIRIRRNIRELLLFVEKERGLSTIVDFFILPIVRAGQWLSEGFQKINLFVFLLDMFIEAPLQLLLQVLEHFITFFREKKEEVY